jgi:single-stranded-DNA-specific exonuclease
MKSSAYIGIKALMDVSGIDLKEVRETHIGFTLAPRINASGRLESASTAVKLLTTNSEQEAQEVAALLDALNKERQRIVDDMVKEAFAIIEERKQAGTLGKVIVVAQTGWNVGVIGIVASKILDAYYRPTIVLGIDEQTGKAKGSARSIPGFDLYKALTHCAHLLEHYGGHQAAAGMTIEQGQLGELAAQLCRLADEWLTDEHFIPVLHADVECGLDEVNLDSIRQLEELAPFGIGNPSPRFMLKGLSMKEIRTMGKDNQHIKLVLAGTAGEPAAVVEAVGFHKAQAVDWISPTASLDIMGELSVNEWNGTRKPQIMIHDLRVPHLQVFDWRGASRVRGRLEELKRKLPQAEDGLAAALVLLADGMKPLTAVSAGAAAEWAIWHLDHTGCLVPGNELAERQPLRNAKDIVLYGLPFDLAALASALKQLKQAERLYAAFCDGDTADGSVMPHRDMFKQVYASLLSDPVKQTPQLTLIRHISRRSGLSETLVRFMLDVFEELEFIELQGDCYKTVPVSAKKPLTSSIRYQARQNRAEVEQALLYSSCKEMSSWVSDTWSQSEHKENNSLIMEDVI